MSDAPDTAVLEVEPPDDSTNNVVYVPFGDESEAHVGPSRDTEMLFRGSVRTRNAELQAAAASSFLAAAADFVAGVAVSSLRRAQAQSHVVPRTFREVQNRYESLRESVITERLISLSEIDALFVGSDERGGSIVFAVARQPSDDLYEAVIVAEDDLVKRLDDEKLEIRVRAHQGRDPVEAVPKGARQVWER